ncbi:hypothetical protein CRG98_013687 [Punica granatum]|uniref:Uncharacterized protein n=1 Tax=Punica granatum TaxID=22663 RepID=A0A2I0KDT9_PUNGR|nr:hypothetical protein CRG98_013687 [Punica granatum]
MQGLNPKVNAGPEADVRSKPNAVNAGPEPDARLEPDAGPKPNAVNAGLIGKCKKCESKVIEPSVDEVDHVVPEYTPFAFCGGSISGKRQKAVNKQASKQTGLSPNPVDVPSGVAKLCVPEFHHVGACMRGAYATRLGSVHLPGDARRTHVRRSRHLPFYDPKVEGRQVTRV